MIRAVFSAYMGKSGNYCFGSYFDYNLKMHVTDEIERLDITHLKMFPINYNKRMSKSTQPKGRQTYV